MAARKTKEEAEKAYKETLALVNGGMTLQDAIAKSGAAESPYRKWLKRTKGGTVTVATPGQHGKVDVRSLPPRPKKGGKRTPKQVDMNDVGSVAMRIARLDKKLRDVEDWVRERVELVARLLILLKQKPKTK